MSSFAHDTPRLAAAYERESELQFESGRQLLERLGLDSSARVLDVGCGTGRLTRWLAQHLGATVVGIDPLEHRIGVARAHRSPARFEVGHAEDLRDFEDASFDVVCLSSVLHWVADKQQALAEIRRVLRPGGRVAVTTLARELSAESTINRVLQPMLRRQPYVDRVERALAPRAYTTTEWVTLVLESGLQLIDLRVTPTESRHEDGEALVEFADASAFGNLLGLVPETLRTTLRAELIAAFDALRGPRGVIVHGWLVSFVARRA